MRFQLLSHHSHTLQFSLVLLWRREDTWRSNIVLVSRALPILLVIFRAWEAGTSANGAAYFESFLGSPEQLLLLPGEGVQ